MKNYFIKPKDKSGTCYHEFYRGKWKKLDFWNDNSICIHDDDIPPRFIETIKKHVPKYDYYGVTEVTSTEWGQIRNELLSIDDKAAITALQADEWMIETFSQHKVFTILGI